MKGLALRVAHLYPKLMNIYGDRGNILCLQHRSEARGISFEVESLELGDPLKAKEYDLIFVGGAQDREQRLVAEDLVKVKAKPLGDGVRRNVAVLAVCGGYQLMGRYPALVFWTCTRSTRALRRSGSSATSSSNGTGRPSLASRTTAAAPSSATGFSRSAAL